MTHNWACKSSFETWDYTFITMRLESHISIFQLPYKLKGALHFTLNYCRQTYFERLMNISIYISDIESKFISCIEILRKTSKDFFYLTPHFNWCHTYFEAASKCFNALDWWDYFFAQWRTLWTRKRTWYTTYGELKHFCKLKNIRRLMTLHNVELFK